MRKHKRTKLTPEQKAFIVRRQDNRCGLTGKVFCEDAGIEFDHTIPLALGGADDLTNIRAVYYYAHQIKTQKDLTKIRERKRMQKVAEAQARNKDRKRRGQKYIPIAGALKAAKLDRLRAWTPEERRQGFKNKAPAG